MPAIRVLIVDQQIPAEAMRSLLLPEFVVTGLVHNVEEAVAACADQKPDVLLLGTCGDAAADLGLILRVRSSADQTRVLILSQLTHRFALAQAVRSGAAGFVLREQTPADLFGALRQVARGKNYVAPQLREHVDWATEVSPARGGPRKRNLTQRQCEVLNLVAEGMTTKQIGVRLNISTKTVEFHRASLMQELGLRSIAELARFAMQSGMIGPA